MNPQTEEMSLTEDKETLQSTLACQETQNVVYHVYLKKT